MGADHHDRPLVRIPSGSTPFTRGTVQRDRPLRQSRRTLLLVLVAKDLLTHGDAQFHIGKPGNYARLSYFFGSHFF
jgi:hypothetical protein